MKKQDKAHTELHKLGIGNSEIKSGHAMLYDQKALKQFNRSNRTKFNPISNC